MNPRLSSTEPWPPRFRAQATFFDGILFLLLVIFSVSLLFINLNSYTEAQDRVLRSSYLVNYLQSTAKALYFLDVNTLKDVKTYCGDSIGAAGSSPKFCRSSLDLYAKDADSPPKDIFNCLALDKYPNYITVADLLKRDVTPAGGAPFMDDKYGTSDKHGRTALRCSLKEIMKPFTFSGYHYLAEVAQPSSSRILETGITPEYITKKDFGYASDYMYEPGFAAYNGTVLGTDPIPFDCNNVSSSQLLVMRSPFQIIPGSGGTGANSVLNWALRICLWPTESKKMP